MFQIIEILEILNKGSSDSEIEQVGNCLDQLATKSPQLFVKASKDLIKINRDVLPLLIPIIKKRCPFNEQLVEPVE